MALIAGIAGGLACSVVGSQSSKITSKIISVISNSLYCKCEIASKEHPELFSAVLHFLAEKAKKSFSNLAPSGSIDNAKLVPGYGETGITLILRGEKFSMTFERKKLDGDQGDLLSISCSKSKRANLELLIQESIQMYEANLFDKVRILSNLGWSSVETKPKRSPSTLVLPAGVWKRLEDDVGHFLLRSTENEYRVKGKPYKRGYLFYGAPGCGKSSCALVLAGRFDLPVYVVNLSDSNMSDMLLQQLFSKVPRRSLILIEDIDVAQMNREPTEDAWESQGKVTLSALLNCLDGVTSYEGSILVCTTNYEDRLDAALKRPGRLDVKIEFEPPNEHQVVLMFRKCKPEYRITPRLRDALKQLIAQKKSVAEWEGLLMLKDKEFQSQLNKLLSH